MFLFRLRFRRKFFFSTWEKNFSDRNKFTLLHSYTVSTNIRLLVNGCYSYTYSSLDKFLAKTKCKNSLAIFSSPYLFIIFIRIKQVSVLTYQRNSVRYFLGIKHWPLCLESYHLRLAVKKSKYVVCSVNLYFKEAKAVSFQLTLSVS